MSGFDDLKFKPWPERDGKSARYQFANGYEVSVIRHKYSYGYDQGLYELAVCDRAGDICYDTPVTDDVCGHLTESDVTELMQKVEALPDAPPMEAK